MLSIKDYENELIALGITDKEQQQTVLNQLYEYVVIINEVYNNK